jgi:hypothetical protein
METNQNSSAHVPGGEDQLAFEKICHHQIKNTTYTKIKKEKHNM